MVPKKSVEISWKDKVSNQEVLKRAGLLVSEMMQRQFRYAEYIGRGSRGELPDVISEGLIEGSQARGRQRGK